MQWLIDLIKAIFAAIFGGKATTVPKPEKSADEPVSGEPKWMKLARAELGVKEVAGPAHNPAVLGYFRDAGFPEIDDDETAWCAGFCNAMIERGGYAGSKSLAARSFLTWGKPVNKPYPGCIAVFSRGDPRSWTGHVGFYVGESGGSIQVLGGNQSNQVSIAPQAKSRLLGYRKPSTPMNSRTVQSAALGIVSAGATGTAILDSQTQIMGIIGVLKDLGTSLPQLMLLTSVLSVAAFGIIIWARYDDNKEKGR
jgi:uncharacterized protein (TIGR02594 family)